MIFFCESIIILITAKTSVMQDIHTNKDDIHEGLSDETADNDNVDVTKRKRRGIVMCESVEEIGQDEEVVTKNLSDEAKEKVFIIPVISLSNIFQGYILGLYRISGSGLKITIRYSPSIYI